ncbi:MAG: hypothetical protein AAGH92_12695 [Planctomycetota bacterium]
MRTKSFFGQHLDPLTLRKHLHEYRSRHEEGLAELTAIDTRLSNEGGEGVRYRRMTAQLGLRLCEATIAWCDDTLAQL